MKKTVVGILIVVVATLVLTSVASAEISHDPSLWAGVYSSGTTDGYYVGGEYMAWGENLGLGIYANFGGGDVDGGYEWNEKLVAAQLGYQLNWKSEEAYSRQLVFKARLGYEISEGENADSGYSNTQKSVLLGLYGEYTAQISNNWVVGIIGEGWTDVSSRLESTWSGDEPESKLSASLGIPISYEVSSDWVAAVQPGISYTGWDKQTAPTLELSAEYDKKITVGLRGEKGKDNDTVGVCVEFNGWSYFE